MGRALHTASPETGRLVSAQPLSGHEIRDSSSSWTKWETGLKMAVAVTRATMTGSYNY